MASATTRRPVRPDDLFKLTFIGDVAISPDRGTICYVQTRMDRETNEYRSDLWTIPATGRVGEAVRFTSEPRTVGQPRWSPDGRWLAFLSDRDGKGKRHLWIIPTTGIGGEARRLTSGDQPVSDYAWAPESERLVFVRSEKSAPPPPNPEPRAYSKSKKEDSSGRIGVSEPLSVRRNPCPRSYHPSPPSW